MTLAQLVILAEEDERAHRDAKRAAADGSPDRGTARDLSMLLGGFD